MGMTKKEIAAKAEYSIGRAGRIPDPSMSNYKVVMATYKAILSDILTMIHDLAVEEEKSPAVTIEVTTTEVTKGE